MYICIYWDHKQQKIKIQIQQLIHILQIILTKICLNFILMLKNPAQKKKEKCPLCLQKQKQLYQLECKHFICSSCFKKSLVQTKNKKLLLCQQCQHLSKINQEVYNQRILRKSYKSTQKRKDQVPEKNTITKQLSANNSKATIIFKDIKTSPFQTNLEPSNSEKQKICNLHFNEKTHICTTCIRDVCIRCLQTICQQHKVFNKQKGMNFIRKEFLNNRYAPKVQQTELKFKLLNERKKLYEQKYIKVNEQIKRSFNHIRQILQKKEEQIILYCNNLYKKVDSDYDRIYENLQQRINVLNNIKNIILNQDISIQSMKKQLKNIQELKQLSIDLNKKIDIDKILDQQKLEKILLQIQNIKVQQLKKQRKVRTSTENAERHSLKVFKTIPSTKIIATNNC